MAPWLDSCLCVPVVGLSFTRAWNIYLKGAASFSPLLDDLTNKGIKFTFFQSPPPSVYTVETSEGYKYTIEPNSAAVHFEYTPERVNPPGGLEQLRRMELRVFSELLEKVAERMEVFAGYLSNGCAGTLEIEKVGIMAICRFERGKEPPGVETLANHFNMFWPKGVKKVDTFVLAQIEQAEKHADQCHHRIQFDTTRSDEQAKELQLLMDWQRVYSDQNPLAVRGNAIKNALEECKRAALGYFERVGEGLDVHE